MARMEGTNKVGGVGLGRPKPMCGFYDFATDGGAVGAISMRGDDRLPPGAILVDSLLKVHTALAGGTVTDTVQIGVEGAADIAAAAARNASPWSTTGVRRLTLTATSAPVLTTVARPLTLTINGSALTAGRLTVIVWWVELEFPNGA